MADEKKIRKIKLADGSVYAIFDTGAIRLNEDNILVTGNSIVDHMILDGKLFIAEIDDVPVEQTITNVLVQDETTGEIKKRSTDKLLEDIGGISYKLENNGVLSLKVGKQDN